MVDAYCHCGISRYLPVEDVLAAMKAAGVGRAVLCQHMGEFDNSYIAGVTRRHPGKFEAIGLLDWSDRGWSDALTELARLGAFKGLRLPSKALARNPAYCEAAASIGFTLVVDLAPGIAHHLPHLTRLLARPDRGAVVVTHLGYPELRDGALVSGRQLLDLAGEPDLYVTVSGQSMLCAYPYHALSAFTLDVIEAFGPQRVMWGSNFPEAGGIAEYRRDLDHLRNCLRLDDAVLAQVTERTAAELWFGPSA